MHVWIVWVGGSRGLGGGCPTHGNFNCLWQMDVFLKCINPCNADVKHASWTPVSHTC